VLKKTTVALMATAENKKTSTTVKWRRLLLGVVVDEVVGEEVDVVVGEVVDVVVGAVEGVVEGMVVGMAVGVAVGVAEAAAERVVMAHNLPVLCCTIQSHFKKWKTELSTQAFI
jgi:Na+/citrate or Na+/malate symporter